MNRKIRLISGKVTWLTHRGIMFRLYTIEGWNCIKTETEIAQNRKCHLIWPVKKCSF